MDPDILQEFDDIFGPAARRIRRPDRVDQGLDRRAEGFARRKGQPLPDVRKGFNRSKEFQVASDDIDRADIPPAPDLVDHDGQIEVDVRGRKYKAPPTREQYYRSASDAEARKLAEDWARDLPPKVPRRTRVKVLKQTLRRVLDLPSTETDQLPDDPVADEGPELRPEDVDHDPTSDVVGDDGVTPLWERLYAAEIAEDLLTEAHMEALSEDDDRIQEREHREWMAPWVKWVRASVGHHYDDEALLSFAEAARAEYAMAGVYEVPDEPFEFVAYREDRNQAVGDDRCVLPNCSNKIYRKRDGLCQKHVKQEKRERMKRSSR